MRELTGQFCNIMLSEDGERVRLTKFRGAGMCLDIFNSGTRSRLLRTRLCSTPAPRDARRRCEWG
jgi:hypothetical protein